MKTVSLLLDNLLSGLGSIVPDHENPVRMHLQAIEMITASISSLEGQLLDYTFADEAEEIHFFKVQKAQFEGRLIFYLRLLKMEERIPDAGADRARYYRRELRRIKTYFRKHMDFYNYLSAGYIHHDQYYFLRAPMPDSAHLVDYGYRYDPRLNTRMSRRVAVFFAYKMLRNHLKEALLDIRETRSTNMEGGKLPWLAKKVDLAELIYALHATSVFGTADLQVIVKFLSTAFNVQFANAYKIFEEIRLRKKNRTSFIDTLRLNLLRRMEQDDEFSL